MKKLINGAGLVWSDLKRTIGAASAVVRYLTMRERIEVAIGGVSAEASVAVIGQPSRYVVRIVNVGDTPWKGQVVIDIAAAEGSAPPDGRYAFFAKHLTMAPYSATMLEVHYDWHTQVTIDIDGQASLPDEFQQGRALRPVQLWAVHTRLVNVRGDLVDELTIYQGMKA